MTKTEHFPWRILFFILLIAAIARALLLISGSLSFHADEAVVGLMARHILQGERPVFFYGQAYMGSLDAWLIALGFRLFGESVLTIRLVQSALYMIATIIGVAVAWRFSGKRTVTMAAGLLLAVPTVNTALYTTATLGGYNETLIFGGLILLWGYAVTNDYQRSLWRWALLGVCAGLGWWTNGLIVVYLLPVACMILYKLILSENDTTLLQRLRTLLPFILLAAGGFILGSAPWWIFDFTHDHAALATYLTNRQTGAYAGIGLPYVPPSQRAIGLLLIGLPTLIGMRFPWSSEYFLAPLGIGIVVIMIAATVRLGRNKTLVYKGARGLILGMMGLFLIVFVASTFGADPTGRYFLPLMLPLAIMLGTAVTPKTKETEPVPTGRSLSAYKGWLLVAIVIGYQAAGQIAAANSPTGFTTQFDLVSHIPNDHDTELIEFLEAHNLNNGYTNYWVAIRLAFLSGEQLQYSSALPYKTTLDYNPADNRYPAYAQATANAEQVAFITTNLPALDAQLETIFAAQGLTYQQTQIGAYHVYYNFATRPIFESFLIPS